MLRDAEVQRSDDSPVADSINKVLVLQRRVIKASLREHKKLLLPLNFNRLFSPLFLAEHMLTLKFRGNNYPEVEQNLLPGRKKRERLNQSSEKLHQLGSIS